jgi:hypothetical protein
MASKRHLRRKQCEGKRAFALEADARAHAIHRSRVSRSYIVAYHCRFCHLWHVGHPNGKVRRILRELRGVNI